MPPLWFQNVRFGRDITNNCPQEIIENFKRTIGQQIDCTFNSTGPIIEEVQSDDEHVSESPAIYEKSIHQESDDDDVSESPTIHDQSVHQESDDELVSEAHTIHEQFMHQESDDEDVPESPAIHKQSIRQESDDEDISESPATHEQSTHEKSIDQVFDGEDISESPATNEQSTHEKSIDQEFNGEDISESPATNEQSTHEKSIDQEFDDEDISDSPAIRERSVNPNPSSARINPEQTTSSRGLRRSQRRRWAPLDFTRLQRPIYQRLPDGNFELKGFDSGFGNNVYGKSRPARAARAAKPKKTCREVPRDADLGPQIALKPAKKGGYLFSCRSEDDIIFGHIHIPVGKYKPVTGTRCAVRYKFIVRQGQVILQSTKDNKTMTMTYLDTENDWYSLPDGLSYGLKNIGSQEARVEYVIINNE